MTNFKRAYDDMLMLFSDHKRNKTASIIRKLKHIGNVQQDECTNVPALRKNKHPLRMHRASALNRIVHADGLTRYTNGMVRLSPIYNFYTVGITNNKDLVKSF